MATARKAKKRKKPSVKAKPSRKPAKKGGKRPRKRPAKRAVAVRKSGTTRTATGKSQSVDQIAQAIADGIKSNAAILPGMALPMVLLRQEFKSASERKITAALAKLFAQGVVRLQADGSYTVNGPR